MNARKYYCDELTILSAGAKGTRREYVHALLTLLQHELGKEELKQQIPAQCLTGMEHLTNGMTTLCREGNEIGHDEIHRVLNEVYLGKKEIEECLNAKVAELNAPASA
jgi:hypothetical protein